MRSRIEKILNGISKSTEDTFRRIYHYRLWGFNSAYDSGAGSNIGIEAYSKLVKSYNANTILDLGCGDFRVGKNLIDNNKYIGIDVVSDLIKHNRKHYQSKNVSFYQADIIEDNLPNADICLVRQVLQHLSLKNIHKILDKLNYPVVLITEHHTEGVPNQDKVDGFMVRKGGIYLELPPFSLKAKRVLTIPHNDWGKLVTYELKEKK